MNKLNTKKFIVVSFILMYYCFLVNFLIRIKPCCDSKLSEAKRITFLTFVLIGIFINIINLINIVRDHPMLEENLPVEDLSKNFLNGIFLLFSIIEIIYIITFIQFLYDLKKCKLSDELENFRKVAFVLQILFIPFLMSKTINNFDIINA